MLQPVDGSVDIGVAIYFFVSTSVGRKQPGPNVHGKICGVESSERSLFYF